MEENTSILELNNVTFTDNSQIILQNISHTIEEGTVTAFLGRPGSGKSTALKILAGLINPTKGKVSFNGTKRNRIQRAFYWNYK